MRGGLRIGKHLVQGNLHRHVVDMVCSCHIIPSTFIQGDSLKEACHIGLFIRRDFTRTAATFHLKEVGLAFLVDHPYNDRQRLKEEASSMAYLPGCRIILHRHPCFDYFITGLNLDFLSSKTHSSS